MAGPDDGFEDAMQLRGQHVRGLVHSIDDTGGKQTVTVETHKDRVLSEVPVHQAFGFGSVAPAAGAVTIIIAAGGDQGDPIALPAENPGAARFGNLGEGDSVIYDASGQRLRFFNGTLTELTVIELVVLAQKVTVTSQQPAVINLPEGGTINGNLVQNGNLTVNGNLGVAGDGETGGNIEAKNVTAAEQVSDHKSSMDGIREIYNTHTNPPGGTDIPPQQM